MGTAGGAGDIPTFIQRLLARPTLAQGQRSVIYASIPDAVAAAACKAAGVGGEVSVALGGKLDPIHAAPLPLQGLDPEAGHGMTTADRLHTRDVGRTQLDRFIVGLDFAIADPTGAEMRPEGLHGRSDDGLSVIHTEKGFFERYACDRLTASILGNRFRYVIAHMATKLRANAFSLVIRDMDDIGNIVVGAEHGTPISIKDVAQVAIGPAIRQGAVTTNGKGETVAGITSTLGGLAIDERAQAAPGIFAAGDDAGGIATGGYASGLAGALVFGRIAAESLATYPPGIPNVLPGERLEAPAVRRVAEREHAALHVLRLLPPDPARALLAGLEQADGVPDADLAKQRPERLGLARLEQLGDRDHRPAPVSPRDPSRRR